MILRFSEQVIREHMGPESWFDSMLRNAEYSWRSYMVASFDSLMADFYLFHGYLVRVRSHC